MKSSFVQAVDTSAVLESLVPGLSESAYDSFHAKPSRSSEEAGLTEGSGFLLVAPNYIPAQSTSSDNKIGLEILQNDEATVGQTARRNRSLKQNVKIAEEIAIIESKSSYISNSNWPNYQAPNIVSVVTLSSFVVFGMLVVLGIASRSNRN